VSSAATFLGADLQSGTDTSADEAALQSAAASLQSDTQAAEDNLVPGCVPGARQAESEGLTDFNKSAVDSENAISEISNGDYSIATGDIQAANAAMQSGSGKSRRLLPTLISTPRADRCRFPVGETVL
jgi:hypothetical protein